MTDTTLLKHPEIKTGDGDGDGFAHIVWRGDDMRGYVEGQVIEALCGKRWVPFKDPKSLPVCPECQEIKDGILAHGGSLM